MNVEDGERGGGVAGVGPILVGCVQCVEEGRGGTREGQWLPTPTIHNRTYINKQQLVHK